MQPPSYDRLLHFCLQIEKYGYLTNDFTLSNQKKMASQQPRPKYWFYPKVDIPKRPQHPLEGLEKMPSAPSAEVTRFYKAALKQEKARRKEEDGCGCTVM
jgi:hypothetical protein